MRHELQRPERQLLVEKKKSEKEGENLRKNMYAFKEL